MSTRSGLAFDLLHPDPFKIRIEDISCHLSKLCRFTGACSEFYSVAQHSIIVARQLPPRLRFAGLLHDAAEAYTGDWSSPMKVVVRELAPGLIEHVHHNVERAVEARFDLRLSTSDRAAIKHADLVALATEKRDLDIKDPLPGWAESSGVLVLPPPLPKKLVPWTHHAARCMFDREVKLLTSSFTEDEEVTPVVTLRASAG
jgi:hypothetical protein